ncbi:hypothetical protein KC845_01615 [Candidatus Kaiserbacteria bacterium]|nr:hypothetical protein [Candidatus Kaiserbacteria bacterium]
MNKQSLIAVVVIFLLIVVGLFAFTYIKKQEMVNNTEPETDNDVISQVDKYNVSEITGKHYFIDGTHTIVGEIIMPTPCDLLDTDVMVAESYPEQVTIDFGVINTSQNCEEKLTSQRFSVTAKVSEEATFNARFMGERVTLNLIPAGEGETPDEFEVYIKG